LRAGVSFVELFDLRWGELGVREAENVFNNNNKKKKRTRRLTHLSVPRSFEGLPSFFQAGKNDNIFFLYFLCHYFIILKELIT